MSPEEILALANINPELEEIVKNGGGVKGIAATIDVVALRAQLAAAVKAVIAANTVSTEESPIHEVDRQITMRDGESIAIRIYTSKTPPAEGSPVLVMYHGGGYCLGGLENEALSCRKWVTECGGVSVNVDYRLAPEHPFPVGVNDAFDVLKWTAANMTEIGGNPSKGFVCGGVSAGANFAAAISHLYRDEKITPPLTGLYLSIPPVLGPNEVPEKYKARYLSREQNKNAPILNDGVVEFFERNYNSDPTSPLANPLLWPTGHADLPPTYFQVCGMDPLRDEGLIYEQALREEWGVMTRMDIYPGLPHGFWSFYPTAEFSKKHLADTMNGWNWLLKQGNLK